MSIEEIERKTATIPAYGGHNYSIFLDPATNVLYGYIELEDEAK